MISAAQSAVSGALMGHDLNSPNAEVRIPIDGALCSIWGHSTRIVPMGVPEVVLLSEDSTPQNPKLHPDAERNFMEAAHRLIQEGVEFYTFLRPTWAVRSLRWTRERC